MRTATVDHPVFILWKEGGGRGRSRGEKSKIERGRKVGGREEEGREGGKKGEREGRREGGRKEKREGGKKRGKEGGRDEREERDKVGKTPDNRLSS